MDTPGAAQPEHERTERLLTLQRDLSIALNKAACLREGLRLCLDAAIQGAEMDCGGIYLLDKGSGDLVLAFHRGLPAGFVDQVARHGAGSEQARLVFRGAPFYTWHIRLPFRLSEKEELESLRAAAVLPFSDGTRVTGCLNVASRVFREVPPFSRVALETIAAQMGSAISRLETAEALLSAREDLERRVEARTRELREANRNLTLEVENRRRAEAELRRSEETFSRAFHSSAVLMAISTVEDGRYVQVNDTFQEVFGYAREQVVGKTSRELGIFVDYGQRDEINRRVREAWSVRDREVRVRTRDGSVRHGSISVDVIAPGDTPFLLTVMKDVTERKRSELELRRAQTLLKAVVEQSPVPMVVAAPDGTLEIFNEACLDQFLIRDEPGLNPGINLFQMRPSWRNYDREGGLVPLGETPRARALRGEVVHGFESRIVRRDGSVRWQMASAAPIRDADGALLGAFVVFPDITALKLGEQQRLEMERSLHQAQKLESLGVLAGGIAHDFNNLLMGILGNTDLALLDVPASSPARGRLEAVLQTAHRCAELARQMLAYSGKGRFVVEAVDLSDVVQEMAHLLEVAVSKQAVLRMELARGLPAVEADATQIRQVVMNLITNASDALGDAYGVIGLSTGTMRFDADGDPAGWMLADTLSPGMHVYVRVRDTGAGMRPQDVPRIFDPFYTTKFTGKGLGLAAVLGIVRGHRGAIRVETGVGKGTTVTVLFPACDAAARGRPSGEEPAPAWRASGAVLLVDDEETVRSAAGQMLEWIGFRVLAAGGGREALELLEKNAGEVVCAVVDLTMPDMDGEQTLREIRRVRPGLPVLLSSGYNEQEVVRRFVKEELSGFIQKPYRLNVLVETLRRVLGT